MVKLGSEQYNSVRRFYDKDAPRYLKDRYEHECNTADGMSYILRKRIILEMVDGEKGLWLDAGCGPGPLAVSLAERGFQLVGIDFSPEMIKIAKEKIRKNDIQGTYFLVNNVDYLGFKKDTFDGVCLIGVLSYVPNIDATMKEIQRILKPGGIAIIQVSNRFSLPELEIRLLLPVWSYLKEIVKTPREEKVRFSKNPYADGDVELAAYFPWWIDSLCKSMGLKKITSAYYDVRIPLIWKIWPKYSARLSSFICNTAFSRSFSFLSAGYIIKVKKEKRD